MVRREGEWSGRREGVWSGGVVREEGGGGRIPQYHNLICSIPFQIIINPSGLGKAVQCPLY